MGVYICQCRLIVWQGFARENDILITVSGFVGHGMRGRGGAGLRTRSNMRQDLRATPLRDGSVPGFLAPLPSPPSR